MKISIYCVLLLLSILGTSCTTHAEQQQSQEVADYSVAELKRLLENYAHVEYQNSQVSRDELRRKLNLLHERDEISNNQYTDENPENEKENPHMKVKMTSNLRESFSEQNEVNNDSTAQVKANPFVRDYFEESTRAGAGLVYTRWGRTVCDGDARPLYKGYMAGGKFDQSGGGSDYLCIPTDPQWGVVFDGIQSHGPQIFGAKYAINNDGRHIHPFSSANNNGVSLFAGNSPCTSCYVATRSVSIMIPARTDCPAGWKKEYTGYLVAEGPIPSRHRTMHACMDGAPEILPGGQIGDWSNAAHVYTVQVGCGHGGLPCNVYKNGWELTCVVCSK